MKIISLILFQLTMMNTFAQFSSIGSGVFHWSELPVKKEALRETRRITEGTTHEFEYFGIHATNQEKGAIPRPPHTQNDIEELIIVKEGTVKATIGNKTAVLGPQSVLLIPPLESQAFENTGDGPLSYYVFMFRSKKPIDMERSTKGGGALIINADTIPLQEKDNKGTKKYFDRPTAMCENFEMHITRLGLKGPSHAPHQHVDTEIILVIDGEVDMTIDGIIYHGGAGDLFIAESNKLHEVSNAANTPCRYFAFKWR